MTNKDKIIHCGLCHSYFHNSGEHTDSRMFKEIELVNQALAEKGLIRVEDVLEIMLKIYANYKVQGVTNYYEELKQQLQELKGEKEK